MALPELCAAVEEARGAFAIIPELGRKLNAVYLDNNSRVALGHISNNDRRFTKYVTRRVDIILHYREQSD